MMVYGVVITDDQQSACLDAMRGIFTSANIVKAAINVGVDEFANVGRIRPELLAYRVADRLLQRQRKAGKIIYIGNRLWVSN